MFPRITDPSDSQIIESLVADYRGVLVCAKQSMYQHILSCQFCIDIVATEGGGGGKTKTAQFLQSELKEILWEEWQLSLSIGAFHFLIQEIVEEVSS